MCEMTSSRRCLARWRGKRTVHISNMLGRDTEPPTKGDVANVGRTRCINSGDALQLQRWVISEQHLRCVLDSSPPCVDKLLEKDLSKYPVCLFPEDCREDDGNTVVAGLNVYGFLLSVVDGADIAALCYTLWRGLGCVLGSFFLQLVELVECLFEGCSHGISLKKGYASDQVIFGVCIPSALLLVLRSVLRTLVFWQVLQVYLDREIV